MRKLNKIIVHCAATRPSWMEGQGLARKRAEIKKWHTRDRGWSDIGYHLLIDRDGAMLEGRPLEKVGAHVKGHNTGSIGICLIGGHGSTQSDNFLDNFTPEQDEALRAAIKNYRNLYGKLSLHGHNEYAAKACPGFNVSRWFRGAANVDPDTAAQGRVGGVVGAAGTGAAAVVIGLQGRSEGLLQWGLIGLVAAVAIFAIWKWRD